MDSFRRLGFEEVQSEAFDELCQLNPKVTPRLLRYQGMGWYDVLVESENGFKIISMGGENGYSQNENYTVYKALSVEDVCSTLEDLIQKIKEDKWVEIVSEAESDGVCLQETAEITPQSQ